MGLWAWPGLRMLLPVVERDVRVLEVSPGLTLSDAFPRVMAGKLSTSFKSRHPVSHSGL